MKTPEQLEKKINSAITEVYDLCERLKISLHADGGLVIAKYSEFDENDDAGERQEIERAMHLPERPVIIKKLAS